MACNHGFRLSKGITRSDVRPRSLGLREPMKIICISDTHGLHGQVEIPECDLLIHAGDATMSGTKGAFASCVSWLEEQPAKEIALIAGNHDFCCQERPDEIAEVIKPTRIHYLNESDINIGGVLIWGSPWSKWFYDWAFNIPKSGESEWWDKFGTHAPAVRPDIIVTHAPPFGYGDVTTRGERVGDLFLGNMIAQVKPVLHVCGHIHESYGLREANGIKFANASVVNRAYRVVNPPIIVDL